MFGDDYNGYDDAGSMATIVNDNNICDAGGGGYDEEEDEEEEEEQDAGSDMNE